MCAILIAYGFRGYPQAFLYDPSRKHVMSQPKHELLHDSSRQDVTSQLKMLHDSSKQDLISQLKHALLHDSSKQDLISQLKHALLHDSSKQDLISQLKHALLHDSSKQDLISQLKHALLHDSSKQDVRSQPKHELLPSSSRQDKMSHPKHELTEMTLQGKKNLVSTTQFEMLKKDHWLKGIAQLDTSSRPTPICHQEQRVLAVEEYCRKHQDMNAKNIPLRNLTYGLFVDDVHKVVMCIHEKVGSTTWRFILADNIKPLDEDNWKPDIHLTLHKFNISRLDDMKYSDEDIRQRLDHYYKVMIVRHPYDRLQSSCFAKFVTKSSLAISDAQEIFANLHPRASEEEIQQGNVSFSDIVCWIQLGNEHHRWEGPYHKRCFPCQVHYDYYVKLETQDRDAEFIINNILSGRPGKMVKNRHQPAMNTVDFRRYLYVMENLPDEQLKFLRKRLQPDLDMFGYSFSEKTLVGKCGNDERQCC